MTIQKNISLKPYNAYGVDVKAKYFVEINTEEELKELLQNEKMQKEKKFILGGGYNTLFVNDFDGLIIHMNIKGIKQLNSPSFKRGAGGVKKHKTEDSPIHIKIGAGEDWEELVEHVVDQNWQGIENLAMIPGSVGAAPVQNIGAYGQVLEDVLVSLEALDAQNGEKREFTKEECKLGYRDSIFKNELKGKYIITNITIRLNQITDEEFGQKFETSYHSRYESLESELEEVAKKPYTLRDIFDAVVSLRTKKLPSVNEYGTVGSTFVNPFVTKEELEKILEKIPDLQYYPVDRMQYPNISDPKLLNSEIVKVPAGWLLDELGWKGKWQDNVGTFEKHALCVVTNKKASGQEILGYIKDMQEDVRENFGIELKPEVNIVE